jgi:uncharacterized lipoprotein YehR (DUF1307 family)
MKRKVLIIVSCIFALSLATIITGCGVGAGTSFPSQSVPLAGSWSGTWDSSASSGTISSATFVCGQENEGVTSINGTITIVGMAGISTGNFTGTMSDYDVNFVASFGNNTSITFSGTKIGSRINGTYSYNDGYIIRNGSFLLNKN